MSVRKLKTILFTLKSSIDMKKELKLLINPELIIRNGIDLYSMMDDLRNVGCIQDGIFVYDSKDESKVFNIFDKYCLNR